MFMKKNSLLLVLFFCAIFHVLVANDNTPVGNPNANKGGTFMFSIGGQPATLHPLSSTDYYATIVKEWVTDSLCARHPNTYEWVPSLAKEWIISKDGTEFTFTIREGVKWHDGKTLTADDIKFSFDAIVNPENKYKTAHLRPYYENIKEMKVIDSKTVKFIVKEKYFLNFDVVAELRIIPKHIYENPDKNELKKLNKTILASGPYKVDKFERGKKLVLKRNKDWWGYADEQFKSKYNFDEVVMKFVKEETIELEMLKKGDIDYMSMTPEVYTKKAVGPVWGKKAFKVKTQNKAPVGYAFLGWNMKKPIFESKNTRKALAFLVNRELMIKKFLYDMSLPATGPWYQQSIYANRVVKPTPYNPKEALKILQEDGWKDTDGDGILDKVLNGVKTPLRFTIIDPLQDFEKYLTVIKESARQIGVDININIVEWSTFLKLLDEKNFDAARLAWSGGGLDYDPKQIWHSSSSNDGGSNFISYNNPEVDKLIDDIRLTLDRKERIPKMQNVFKIIAQDYPYVFFFNSKYSLYGHGQKIKKETDTYQYSIGSSYWWMEK